MVAVEIFVVVAKIDVVDVVFTVVALVLNIFIVDELRIGVEVKVDRLDMVVFEDDVVNVKGLGLVEVETFLVVVEQLTSSEESLQSGKSSHCHLKLIQFPFWH